MNPEELQEALRNIGPVCARQLVEIGIDTPEKLKKLGAVKTYEKLLTSGVQCGCINAAYLYALEGAINNCDWRDLPEKRKEEFKTYTANLREKYQ